MHVYIRVHKKYNAYIKLNAAYTYRLDDSLNFVSFQDYSILQALVGFCHLLYSYPSCYSAFFVLKRFLLWVTASFSSDRFRRRQRNRIFAVSNRLRVYTLGGWFCLVAVLRLCSCVFWVGAEGERILVCRWVFEVRNDSSHFLHEVSSVLVNAMFFRWFNFCVDAQCSSFRSVRVCVVSSIFGQLLETAVTEPFPSEQAFVQNVMPAFCVCVRG